MSEDATTADQPPEEDPEREPDSVADDVWTRATAPQTPYTSRQVGIGLVLFVIGAVVAFGLPLLVT